MKLTIAKTEFQFSAFSIMLYLLLIALLISLGFWQLGRSEQKRVFIDQQQLSAKKTILKIVATIDLNRDRYRKIELKGAYQPDKQYLIDNQIVNGQAGYYVMTPFIVFETGEALLINRGWVKLNKDRRILPEIVVDDSKRIITGRVNAFPVIGIRLAGAEIPTEGWPSVVQVVDTHVLSNKLGYALLPFQIELDKTMSHGYSRDWKKKTIMSPEKHIAYAVQWFGLALTLTILFFGFSRKIDERTE